MTISYAQQQHRADKLATVNIGPSETDQSGANDTDINVIVKRYGVYGTVPSGKKAPMYGQDLTMVPDDLRACIETVRSLETLRGELPKELGNLTLEELVSYSPQDIAALLKPKDKPIEETK